jgi:transcriptional regulator with XRE-family HTH domain
MLSLEPLMKRLGLSASRLAELSGVHRNTLGYADTTTGNRRRLTPATLRRVADGLDRYARLLTKEAKKLRAEAAAHDPRSTRR